MSDQPGPTSEGSLATRIDRQKAHPLAWPTVVNRAVVVAVAGISIYLVFPTISEVFASWPRLRSMVLGQQRLRQLGLPKRMERRPLGRRFHQCPYPE